MVVTTYIIEGSALIERIHELKQWVYDGSIRICIPLCALDQIDASYKASLVPKEVQKEANIKKPSGRAARREQPLFDINPRTVREYLLRAQSEKGEEGVKLQSTEQEFAQWKEEEKEVAKPESPPPAPTSFAEAVSRKLNMKDEPSSLGLKGYSKPRLVAKANEPKSPWKYQKIPHVPSQGIPAYLKSLFSYVLWCLYGYENNPLMPKIFVLLLDNPEARAVAERLNIPVQSYATVRLSILQSKASHDNRLSYGQLERDFPTAAAKSALQAEQVMANGNGILTNGSSQLGAASGPELDQKHQQLETGVVSENDSMLVVKESETTAVNNSEKVIEDRIRESTDPQDTSNGVLQATDGAHMEEYDLKETEDSTKLHVEQDHTIPPKSVDVESAGKDLCQGLDADVSEVKITPPAEVKAKESAESEIDSDEEIIVFNPRARRASGAPKKPTDATRSRPTTANGLTPYKLADVREAAIEPVKSRPTTAHGHPSQPNATLKPKPQIESTLKPQSPVFTPGQIYMPSQAQVLETTKPVGGREIVEAARDQETVHETSPKNATAEIHKHSTPPPRHPRASLQQNHPSQEQLHLQRQSERIIQRQRELIQRQSKATEKIAQPPQPPRQIQMEPTSNPTVIDPNDFDRSYVVQPLAKTPEGVNGKRRSGGHRRRSPKSGSKDASKDTSKDVPKTSPPKRETRRQEADVDFVLKSGAPRSSTRGRGKLWVP